MAKLLIISSNHFLYKLSLVSFAFTVFELSSWPSLISYQIFKAHIFSLCQSLKKSEKTSSPEAHSLPLFVFTDLRSRKFWCCAPKAHKNSYASKWIQKCHFLHNFVLTLLLVIKGLVLCSYELVWWRMIEWTWWFHGQVI